MYRPYATRSPGTAGVTMYAAIANAPGGTSAVAGTRKAPRPLKSTDPNITAAASADRPMIQRCAPCVPAIGTRARLKPRAPTMPPTVFDAYILPARRATSTSGLEAAASASGKLAPQRHADGSTAHAHLVRSSWKVNHGLGASSGLMGQYGNARPIISAANATAAI